MINVHNAKNRDGIWLSPDKRKSAEFIRVINTSQIILNFHDKFVVTGSSVASGNFSEGDIRFHWTDDSTLSIAYSKSVEFVQKDSSVYFFGESIAVHYQEIDKEPGTDF